MASEKSSNTNASNLAEKEAEALRPRISIGLGVACLIFLALSVGLTSYLVSQRSTQVCRALPTANPPRYKVKLDCEVLIIGSGFAGSFVAYQLAPLYGTRVCLVEKAERDGGRVYDIPEQPNGPVFGFGALWVMADQVAMINLARLLNITLQPDLDDVELLKVRNFCTSPPSRILQKILREFELRESCMIPI